MASIGRYARASTSLATVADRPSTSDRGSSSSESFGWMRDAEPSHCALLTSGARIVRAKVKVTTPRNLAGARPMVCSCRVVQPGFAKADV